MEGCRVRKVKIEKDELFIIRSAEVKAYAKEGGVVEVVFESVRNPYFSIVRILKDSKKKKKLKPNKRYSFEEIKKSF